MYRKKVLLHKLSVSYLVLHCITTQPAVIIKGSADQTSNYALPTKVTAKAFDQKTGSFVVGLQAGASEYAISIANAQSNEFLPLASESSVNNNEIELLSLTPIDAQVNPFYISLTEQASTGPFQQSMVTVLNPVTKTAVQTVDINDASGSAKTGGICGLASTTNGLFVAVKDTTNAPFGNGNSGIAFIKITGEQESFTATPIDATTGLAGNKAVNLELQPFDIIFGSSGAFNNLTNDPIPLVWDEQLAILYAGISTELISGLQNTIARLYFDPATGSLTPTAILNFNAINGDNIVANNVPGNQLQIKKIGVMHTSTGGTYLIVARQQNIFALPLVDTPENLVDHGKLANANQTVIDGKFTTAATSPGDLLTLSSLAAMVGDPNNIPNDLNAAFSLATSTYTDMQIVGDTVYLGVKNNSFGYVLSSQALFDESGKIVRWTPWSQRAVPVNCFPGLAMPATDVEHSGKIDFFSIDLVEGRAWIVEGDTGRLVGRTEWTDYFESPSLCFMLNQKLSKGCLSSLDLHHKHSLIGLNKNNYCLFGGMSTVVFARTRDEVLSAMSPAGTISDYVDPKNLIITYLPEKNLPVIGLEYTAENTNNYFLAATPKGLYVFGGNATGTGFNAADLDTLDQEPFTTGSWILAPAEALQKSIVSICCAQANIYIITFDPDDTNSTYKLFSINPVAKTTIDTAFSSSNLVLLAQTTQNSFQSIKAFLAAAVVHTPNSLADSAINMAEQLFVATNQGLWVSKSTAGTHGLANASDDAEANWQPISTFEKNLFQGIGTIDTPVQHTVWPFMIPQASACSFNLQSNINQISNTAVGQMPDFVPFDFNSNSFDTALKTFEPIRFFWTDGARRFFIFSDLRFSQPAGALAVLPFDTDSVLLNNPYFFNEPAVARYNQFYWIRTIHDLGIILAGTEKGVISLQ
ncbi:hypothetical protein IPH25_04360 [bacterium]|nr:MAG: hypothetical protein IPG37_01355 [bacterium]QQR61680.1 MAG: hypothetical protein IPH25_04360 [bacterium]QQR62753.1 MAG: hypothetical protein IPH67_05080 [bacterium]